MWGRRSCKRRRMTPPPPLHPKNCCGSEGDVNWMKHELALDPSALDRDNERNRGIPPLMIAIHMRHEACAKFLIESGADVDEDGFEGITPVFCALQNDKPDILKLLLDSNVDFTSIMKCTGEVPLVNAIILQKVELVELLLQYGADPNIKASKCRNEASCLAIALNRGNAKITRSLLEHKVCIKDCLETNEKLIHHVFSTILLGHLDCLKQLLLYGAWHVMKREQVIREDELQYPSNISVVSIVIHSETDRRTKEQVVELLSNMGINYWKCDENNPHIWELLKIHDGNEPTFADELISYVKQVRSQPLSLKSLSRIAIQNHIPTTYVKCIRKFEIPETLIPFLEYKDIY